MDPISDMLNQIRNAQQVAKEIVSLSFSNLKFGILQILETQKFIQKIEKKGKGPKKILDIFLRYNDKIPAFSGFKKISKPGRKMYLSAKDLKSRNRNGGIIIISSSQGLMTSRDAKNKKLGGEVICEVW